MKVIDLLNKIANKEEVPKKIKVLFNIFEYDEDNYNYKNVDKTQDNLLRHLGHYKGIALNDEVEIIEDAPKKDKKKDKKIERIDCWYQYDDINDKELTKIMLDELKDRINEIIDRLNGE